MPFAPARSPAAFNATAAHGPGDESAPKMADPDADWEAKCGELEKMNKKLKAKLRKTLQEKDELIAAAASAPAGDGSAAPAEGAAPAAGGDGDSAERIAALETEVHEGKVLIKKYGRGWRVIAWLDGYCAV